MITHLDVVVGLERNIKFVRDKVIVKVSGIKVLLYSIEKSDSKFTAGKERLEMTEDNIKLNTRIYLYLLIVLAQAILPSGEVRLIIDRALHSGDEFRQKLIKAVLRDDTNKRGH